MNQREIRFRAWDKKEKKMYEWPFIIHHFDDEIRVHKVGSGYVQIPMKEIELMQYTGLKDKFGKEIYEGDIVEFEDESGTTEDEVIFKNGSFVAKDNSSWHIIFSKVIGNIYENEEEEQEKRCEKCGGELGTKIIGDESYDYCFVCKWITH